MSQTCLFGARLCGRKSAAERLRLDVVGTDSLAVDLDDRDQFPVARLELRVALDRDLHMLELELVAERGELCRGPPAEVTALRLVENDPGRLHRPGPNHLVTARSHAVVAMSWSKAS